jgi:uncharacterized protein YjiS (DUF1127 family)
MITCDFDFSAASSTTPDRPAVKEASGPLAGASFLEQAPDLAKESGLHTRENSGWAITASQAGTPSAISFSGAFQALLRSLQRWREADRVRAELERLGELGLADLGVTRNDIPAIVRGTYRTD